MYREEALAAGQKRDNFLNTENEASGKKKAGVV